MIKIILDTNIIGDAHLPSPPDWLLEWFGSLPPGAIAIPSIVIYETEYGIRLAERHNPLKAGYVLEWFEELLEQNLEVLDLSIAGSRLLGRMAACPALRHIFETPPRFNKHGEEIKNNKIRLGADAMIAAISIAHGIPVATRNTRDFLHIHRFFPLPGLYDPARDNWSVDPPPGWGLTNNANDDERDNLPRAELAFEA
ncbi:type II toxin-antitoxin system VapC family toxin [Rhizobium ruizarguesonis]|uniref:type II toxin-antitoxin system VapC family toxin n=1 Tax=Rhizobium ruizarguesonis TaxID=2081791 RepID=UPI0010302142|nr:PIN domain-containing protein [Rhizobium ruizarguesonis]TBB21269.1 type II toxin-antitoxin system VapC family toxin [Rhizobium ruizarguesonis]